jgi:prepilin-type N-terminal cleavage/methylation domain-containing protein
VKSEIRNPKSEASQLPPGRFHTARRRSAFTLLELLIAIAIFSIVLTAINGVFYSAMRLQNKAARTVEEALPIQQAAAVLKRDFQGIVAPGGVLGGFLQSPTTSAVTGGSPIPPTATTLYTATGVLDNTSPWADVQKVVYYLKNPDRQNTAGRDLMRAVSRNLLPTTQDVLEESWLMGGVDRLQLSF